MVVTVSDESKDIARANRSAGYKLRNGIHMPVVGYGTWALPDSPECAKAVCDAIRAGYRLIDGAAFYKNERSVGKGIRAAISQGVARSELFVTSKVWVENLGYQNTMDSFFKSLNDLELDYLDLYLIHWPASPNKHPNWLDLNCATWRAMVELYEEGYVRAIGVSNFLPHHLEKLLSFRVAPMVNQLEVHPGYSQRALVTLCQEHGIVVEGWSPFGRGAVLKDATINAIADAHECTAAQVCLAFCRQLKVIPLPKSSASNRMVSNLDFLDITLSTAEMGQLLALDDIKLGYSREQPDR